MKKIAVIPARGGSKRIPRKNIKPFFGKPIISYSLESCSQAGIFDHIHVSTEDSEIFEIVSQLGYPPLFYRSQENASDQAPVREVLKETLKVFEEKGMPFDIVCLLSAISPLIDGEDLKNAFDSFEKSDMSYPMLAVSKYPAPIEWALKFQADKNIIEPLNNDLFFASSHGFQDTYYDIGSFAFFTKEQLEKNDQEIKFIPYVVPLHKSVDVDNMDDWAILEKFYLMKNLPSTSHL